MPMYVIMKDPVMYSSYDAQYIEIGPKWNLGYTVKCPEISKYYAFCKD